MIDIRLYVLTWYLNIKKMKAHEECILWGLINLSSIPYEKICMVIKMTTFVAQFIVAPLLNT